MSRIAVSFDFFGGHEKTIVGRLDPLDHWKMLAGAIEAANPDGRHDVIVTAIDWSMWDVLEPERMLAWEIYRRARVVVCYPQNPGHQLGACWCLRMALEAAEAIGAEFLVHLADDVLLMTMSVNEMVRQLGDSVYRGSSWGMQHCANAQVFVCRVAAMRDSSTGNMIINPIEFGGHGLLEHYLWQKLMQHWGPDRITIDPDWRPEKMYFHSHYPSQFFEFLAARKAVDGRSGN